MKTKLKIGDKVRVINKDCEYFGKMGIITRDDDTFDWRVAFENNVDDYEFYDNKDLQLIKPVRRVSKKKPSMEKLRQKFVTFMSNIKGEYGYFLKIWNWINENFTAKSELIKPKTKWKYSRKEISQKLNYFSSGRYKYIENVVEDLLAKSEYTEDKSDKLKRPTLPEKIEGLPASLQYEMRDNILATLANKLNELIDNQNQIISYLENKSNV